MALALTTGTAGVKQRNYRVFIAANDYNFDWAAICANIVLFNTAIVAKDYTTAYTKFALVLAAMTEVGECRADSVESLISDGNSVDGNTLGKLVLAKTGSFNAELINATPANIAGLASIDGKEVIIILTETDGHDEFFTSVAPTSYGDYLSQDSHKVIFICNYDSIVAGVVTSVGRRLSISNKETGGGIITVSLAIEDSVPDAGSFRAIKSVPYSLVDGIDPFGVEDAISTEIELSWDGTAMPDKDGCLIDVSTVSSFASFITGWQNKYVPSSAANIIVTGLTPDTYYYFRICAVKNGRIISSYSEILKEKTPAS